MNPILSVLSSTNKNQIFNGGMTMKKLFTLPIIIASVVIDVTAVQAKPSYRAKKRQSRKI